MYNRGFIQVKKLVVWTKPSWITLNLLLPTTAFISRGGGGRVGGGGGGRRVGRRRKRRSYEEL